MARKLKMFEATGFSRYPNASVSRDMTSALKGDGVSGGPKAVGAFIRRITKRAVVDCVIIARSRSGSAETSEGVSEEFQPLTKAMLRDGNVGAVSYSEAAQKYRDALSLTYGLLN